MEHFIFLVIMYIEPIFYKLIYMSAGAIIIGLAIIIIKEIFKNKLSYKWITILWSVFIFSLIIPFELRTPISIYNLIPIYFENIGEIHPAYNYNCEFESAKANNMDAEEIASFQVQYYIFLGIILVWLAFVTYYALVYICEQIELNSIIKKKKIKDERLIRILEKCKKELNIRKDIILVNNKNAKQPSICGIFKIKILLSDEIISLADCDIYNIFLHELSHYERKDILYNFVITVIKGMYIFNPAILLLLEELKKDIELATDEYALYYKNEEDKKEYIRTLNRLKKFEKNKFFLYEIGIIEKVGNLDRRTKNIEKIRENISNSKRISKFATTVLIILFFVLFTKGKNYKSREELYNLCTAINNYNNVHIKNEWYYNEELSNVEDYYWKDSVMVEKSNFNDAEITIYSNFGNSQEIGITNFNGDKKIRYGRIQDSMISPSQKMSAVESLQYWGTDYIWCGTEEIRGREAYKIAFISSPSYKKFYWIDKEKNLILKVEDIWDNTESHESYYYYEFDSVTDEDVKRPYTKDYPDYEVILDNQ